MLLWGGGGGGGGGGGKNNRSLEPIFYVHKSRRIKRQWMKNDKP